jgi:glycosyltransferase involved in cell wall biosynthesis
MPSDGSFVTPAARSPLRIIEVVNVRWFNATAWYGLTLSRLLKNAGHEVRVLGLAGTASYAKAREMGLNPLPCDANTLSPLALPAMLRQMASLLREFRPHVVNCHRGEGMVFWALLKAAGFSFALVRTRGDQRPPKAGIGNRTLYSRLVDALVATNSRTARECRALLGVEERRLFIIPGGVDERRFAPNAGSREKVRGAYGLADDDILVGLLGRFDPVKGQRELMDALSRLPGMRRSALSGSRSPRVRLLFVGLPAALSRKTLEDWAREYGIEGCLVVDGPEADVAAHINAMDLGVVASQGSEAIARAAFEIMACGVPLVGTDVGVMPDLLSRRALSPVGDTSALASLLDRALSDASFREELRHEQSRRMSAFSEEKFLEQTLAVYYAALERLPRAERGGKR